MRKPNPKTQIGKVIVQRCNELGITLSQLEKEAQLGHGLLSAYSKGSMTPSKRTVIRIERKLKMKEGTIEFMIERQESDEDDIGHKPSRREQKVLDAWDRGNRTPEQVAQITGYPIKVVGMYLPL